MEDENGQGETGAQGGLDEAKEFSWFQEIERKQKQIEILSRRGKEKTQEIKRLQAQIDTLEGKTKAAKLEGGAQTAADREGDKGDPAPARTNKEKYYPHDPRYWMDD
jgi:hypothetical protein